MVNKNQFIEFLNYIGIINKNHQLKIYKAYLRCWNKTSMPRQRKRGEVNENYKKYRMSNLKVIMTTKEYEEDAIASVIAYLVHLDFRESMDKEVKEYGHLGVWGKNLATNES